MEHHAAEEPARSPRSLAQRLLITFNCVLIAGCLTLVGSAGYFYNRIGNIPRIDFGDGVLGSPAGRSDPSGAQNYLLVGSDTREGQDAESFGTAEETGEARADTVILVRVDPGQETAAIVSFPRDLWLEIYDPGGEELGEQRLNTAFEGGPERLIATIRHNFDIPVDHYAQVNFAGFRDLVEAVGGVDMFLAGPVRDRDDTGRNVAGLDVDQTGCVTLDGTQALAYVRSRHFEQFVDGEWQADPSGDLGRIQRQQDFIRRALREALSEGMTNPVKVNQLLDVAEDNVVIDDQLDGGDLMHVGQRFRTLTPDTLHQRGLVVEQWRTDGGAAVLRLVDDPANEATFDIFRGVEPRQPAAVSPASVHVRVLNGTGRAGEAGAARDELSGAGFEVVGVGDGAFGTDVTTIAFGAGQEDAADLLARHLASPGARLVADPTLTVDLVLTTGADYEGLLDGPRPIEAGPPEEAPADPVPVDDEGDEEPPAPEC
jgi:polyisoprenyl-teichoic acid--peptidoglycan teichoic acid transferase